MARRQIEGLRGIVTGASSGIGIALVRKLARRGARLIVTARREDRLKELIHEIRSEGDEIFSVAGDLTDEQTRRELIQAARERLGGLDLLINNAGVGATGRFDSSSPDRVRQVMEVNFFAPVELTRLALPLLQDGNQPILINISSIVGLRATPYNTEYSASKFAIQGFSEALRAELKPIGIDLLTVCPGTTQTEFFDVLLEETGQPNFPSHRPVTADYVAQSTVRAIRKGKHIIIPYKWGKVCWWLNRLSPRFMDWLMARYV
jgi:short-subunit dehydrogenase